ncbi:hypothetical protein ONR57_14555 [Hoyosella sp. YIM 151337]|uniref:hypothetical protein n=1 Tax=Hoyosella sp. YIM 151337 TaxID=2992742 RepID=UPI002235EC9E|nr:hypothetical protein [Hoyosella sp. YIM 151337]MCW4354527.1 hypothetical protein [Hoyosella sp. YIM 151337]
MVVNSTSASSKNPTADPAEENAFFPSSWSLGQYTSAKTDFDGTTIDAPTYDGSRWKVPVIATEER